MHPPELITYPVADHVPAVAVFAISGGLKQSWDNFTGLLPSGFYWVIGVAGVVIVVLAIIGWLWQHRHGGQEKKLLKSLPVVGLAVGLVMASPKTIVPIFLFILEALVNVFMPILQAIFNHLGS